MKVFLSSTYVDLIEYRRAAAEALERLGQQVGRMEIFGARPVEPSDACLSEIEDCDLFVGIYAHRYGHIPAGSTVSITEAEFRHARKHNKPIFCFVVEDNHPWPPAMIESEPGRTKLIALKAEISSNLVRDTFTTPENLASKIATSIGRHLIQSSSVVESDSSKKARREDLSKQFSLLLEFLGKPASEFSTLQGVGNTWDVQWPREKAQGIREWVECHRPLFPEHVQTALTGIMHLAGTTVVEQGMQLAQRPESFQMSGEWLDTVRKYVKELKAELYGTA